MNKIGRNDPCPCGSGLKYKKCCLAKEIAAAPVVTSLTGQRMRQANGGLFEPLMQHMLAHYAEDAFAQAWDEFSNWNDVPVSIEDYPELETAFPPWLVYHWVPDNSEADEDDWQPEITIAEHYKHSMGNRISTFDRRFIEAACAEQFSYWHVLDCVPGQSVRLRDIMRGHELTVPDRYMSQNIDPGQVIFASIVTMDGESMVLGAAPYALPPVCANQLIDFRERIAGAEFAPSPSLSKDLSLLTTDLLFENDLELRDYYWEVRELILNPVPPRMHNTDGEELIPTTLHYQLSCTPTQAVEALATLALSKPEDLMRDGQTDSRGKLVSADFPWLKKGNAQHQDWNNTVLGEIRIDGQNLTVEVNSRERSDSIKRRIAQRLKKLAILINEETQTIDEMMAKHQANTQTQDRQSALQSDDLMAMPEVRAKMAEMTAQHWRQWLDISLPALNGQTPCEAAKTASGRERLEALLLDFSEKQRGDPVLDPDIAMLRRELKLE